MKQLFLFIVLFFCLGIFAQAPQNFSYQAVVRNGDNKLLTNATHGIISLQAQESVNTAGGTESGASGSVAYSVGQVFYSSDESSTGSINEGVQIPYEILVVTSIEGSEVIKLEASAYPNPTTDFLILQMGNYTLTDLKYQLYSAGGKMLNEHIIESDRTHINFEMYTSGIYYLMVNLEGTQIKTFKVIKN